MKETDEQKSNKQIEHKEAKRQMKSRTCCDTNFGIKALLNHKSVHLVYPPLPYASSLDLPDSSFMMMVTS